MLVAPSQHVHLQQTPGLLPMSLKSQDLILVGPYKHSCRIHILLFLLDTELM